MISEVEIIVKLFKQQIILKISRLLKPKRPTLYVTFLLPV